jgi:4-hydroxybenzoate polyprenyltransferase
VQSVDDLTVRALWGVLQAVAPALLMNLCIVGYNQLCDVDIDKARAAVAAACMHGAETEPAQVNKPQLPLASGDFTMRQGWTIVVGSGALSLLLGACLACMSSVRALTRAHQERSRARSPSSSRCLSGALALRAESPDFAHCSPPA